MKRFSFRLESVLGYKKSLERQAQRDLHTAKNAHMAKENAIGEMKKQRGILCREREKKETLGIGVPEYQAYRSYLHRIDQDLDNAHRQLEELGEEVHRRIAVLRSASIQKETLETLRADQERTHRESDEREEQKSLDELILMRRGQVT